MPGQPEQLAESGRLPESERLAGPRRAPEAPRPNEAREARDIGADLRARLERLPFTHPSSPYKPDGSRKPPEPDPRERELPLPREAERTDLPEEDGPRIDPDGSWHWKGRDLSPDQNRIADEALDRFRTAEGRDADGKYGDHGLTPAMRRIESQLEHGRLVPDTEKFALKSPDRFKEKLAKLISDEPDSDPEEIARRINDGIRYTYIFDDQGYSSGVMNTCDSLSGSGFKLNERKNAWADETKPYKGVNTSWAEASSGTIFEVQVHTPASWEGKQASHDEYEVIGTPSSTPEERKRAGDRQDEIFARVPFPPGIKEVPSYRAEGW